MTCWIDKILHLHSTACAQVIKLLHDMKAELESDGKNDQAIYDKLASPPEAQWVDSELFAGNESLKAATGRC